MTHHKNPLCLIILKTIRLMGEAYWAENVFLVFLYNFLWGTHKMDGDMHEDLHIVSDFNQNWNVLINFSTTPQYQFSWKSIQQFSSCYMLTDEWTDTVDLRDIFATLVVVSNMPKSLQNTLHKLSHICTTCVEMEGRNKTWKGISDVITSTWTTRLKKTRLLRSMIGLNKSQYLSMECPVLCVCQAKRGQWTTSHSVV
jgi:hypothetical protein